MNLLSFEDRPSWFHGDFRVPPHHSPNNQSLGPKPGISQLDTVVAIWGDVTRDIGKWMDNNG